MKNTNILYLLSGILVYFALKYFIPYGNYIIYPFQILVTFLHEFGHAFFAFITGGSIKSIQINTDGSGLAVTAGGWRSFVIAGGYIGSAVFGNILLYISYTSKKYSEIALYVLSGLMFLSGIIFFHNIISTLLLFLVGGALFFIAYKGTYEDIFLQFLGVIVILYIIEDFNVGPSSDLAAFSKIFIIVPQAIWMYIWLIIVLLMSGYNLKKIFQKK